MKSLAKPGDKICFTLYPIVPVTKKSTRSQSKYLNKGYLCDSQAVLCLTFPHALPLYHIRASVFVLWCNSMLWQRLLQQRESNSVPHYLPAWSIFWGSSPLVPGRWKTKNETTLRSYGSSSAWWRGWCLRLHIDAAKWSSKHLQWQQKVFSDTFSINFIYYFLNTNLVPIITLQQKTCLVLLYQSSWKCFTY